MKTKQMNLLKNVYLQFLTPCSFNPRPSEMYKIIMELNNKTSPGQDNIPTSALKADAHLIYKPLYYLVNQSFGSLGYIPQKYKIRLKNQLLLELFLHKIKFLRKNRLDQLRVFSVSFANYSLLNTTINSIIEISHVVSVFCHILKAFNFIVHEILSKKQNFYGIRGI